MSSGIVVFPSTLNTTHTTVQIACGSEHVLALVKSLDQDSATPTSQIWGWGWNEHGNLGLGDTEDVKLPVRIWPFGVGVSVDVSGVWAVGIVTGKPWGLCVFTVFSL